MEVREYLTTEGRSPFARWFNKLDARAAVKVTIALYRIEQGNLSNTKGIGGIFEYKITFGPGYRVYFGRDGDVLVLLLGGGTKKTQSREILLAKQFWVDYKQRKSRGKES